MTTITTNTSATRRFSFNPLRWLLKADAAYRQNHALRQATPEQLDDMGISRKDVDTAIYRKFADE